MTQAGKGSPIKIYRIVDCSRVLCRSFSSHVRPSPSLARKALKVIFSPFGRPPQRIEQARKAPESMSGALNTREDQSSQQPLAQVHRLLSVILQDLLLGRGAVRGLDEYLVKLDHIEPEIGQIPEVDQVSVEQAPERIPVGQWDFLQEHHGSLL